MFLKTIVNIIFFTPCVLLSSVNDNAIIIRYYGKIENAKERNGLDVRLKKAKEDYERDIKKETEKYEKDQEKWEKKERKDKKEIKAYKHQLELKKLKESDSDSDSD